MSISPAPENRLLAALPSADYARLTARMTDVTFDIKEVAYRGGGPIDHVYFPRSGVLSAVIVMLDGATAEVAIIGRESMAWVAAALGADRSGEEVFCQMTPCACRKIPTADFVAEVRRGGALREVVDGCLRAALAASARQTACNCLHTVDERCAVAADVPRPGRWRRVRADPGVPGRDARVRGPRSRSRPVRCKAPG